MSTTRHDFLSEPARRVHHALAQGQASADMLRRQLSLERRVVNRALYRELEPRGLVHRSQETPPMWAQVPSGDRTGAEPETWTWVGIDLGHIHDCLAPAAALLEDGRSDLKVQGYADFASNGRDLQTHRELVRRAPCNQSDYADLMLILDAGEACRERHPPELVVIASRDKIIQAAVMLMRERFPDTQFELVGSWTELREFVE